MKKLITSVSAALITTVFTSSCFAAPLMLAYDGAVHEYNGEIYSLQINGEPVISKVPTIILNDRALVAARAVFEKVGAKVDWDGANEKVLVSMNNSTVELKINDKNAVVNDKVVQLDVPPKIINDSTMLPARFVAEQLNMKVGWNPNKGVIMIDKSNLRSISYDSIQDTEIVTISLDYYKNYRILNFDPARIVIDFPNVSTLSEPQKMDVKGNAVKGVRYAYFEDPNTGFEAARVVLDVDPESKYQVEEKEGQLVLYVKKDRDVSDRGDDDRTDVTSPTVTPAITPTPTPIATPIPGVTPTPGPGITPDPTVTPTPSPNPTVTPMPSPSPTVTPTPGSSPTATPIPTSSPSPAVTPGTIKGLVDAGVIKHSRIGSQDVVEISIDNYKGYKVVRVTDPERIVIDIPNIAAPSKEQKIAANSSLIKSIRCAQFEDNTARIVLDVTGQPPYEIEEKDGKLILRISEPRYRNIVYHSNGDKVYFTLPGAVLTEHPRDLKKLYTEKYDEDGRKYTITFPSKQADLGTGFMRINDSYMDSIEITSDSAAGLTSITFNTKNPLGYEIISRYNYNTNAIIDTAITLLKPSTKAEKLVVIDPGHGGFETGAASGGLMEKNLNMDIAVRLNGLLTSKGIKTYMLRQDDSYVDLYERAYIANHLNAALFISIHNNSFNGVTKGTETLYFPSGSNASGFSSKSFAEIVQNKLVSALGTKNRGIIERPGLVVLNKTDMPAVLAEIGFMDNTEERANLNTPEFRQKAAEALCEAIIQSLEKVK